MEVVGGGVGPTTCGPESIFSQSDMGSCPTQCVLWAHGPVKGIYAHQVKRCFKKQGSTGETLKNVLWDSRNPQSLP